MAPTVDSRTGRPYAAACSGNEKWCRCRKHQGLRTLQRRRARIGEWTGEGFRSGPTLEELAWAAGLFAGEGWCGLARRQGKYAWIALSIKMLDERSVRRFADLWGRRVYKYRLSYDKTRYCFSMNATARTAERMLADMWPYLEGTAKGDQVERAAREMGVFEFVNGSATEMRSRRDGGNQWSGRHHTPETKAKMAEAAKSWRAKKRAADE